MLEVNLMDDQPVKVFQFPPNTAAFVKMYDQDKAKQTLLTLFKENFLLSLRDMSIAQSPDSRGMTGERSRSQTNPLPFTSEFTKKPMTSSPRFGALSHHSFFSRHNPHPHRVRHIQGLNGRPVCMVRDDWYVTSSLFPHPLLKSHVLRKAAEPPVAFRPAQNSNGVSTSKSKSALFSEAWREELKELAAKVSLPSEAQKDKKEQPEEEFVRRKTQYSAETGRIIPPSSKSYQRRSHSQRLLYPQPFHDQELMVKYFYAHVPPFRKVSFMVLELLCQILQTDSLSTVQQWLLLAGQREKDLVMGMIKQALDGVELSASPQQQLQALPGASPQIHGPSFDQSWRKPQRMRLCSDQYQYESQSQIKLDILRIEYSNKTKIKFPFQISYFCHLDQPFDLSHHNFHPIIRPQLDSHAVASFPPTTPTITRDQSNSLSKTSSEMLGIQNGKIPHFKALFEAPVNNTDKNPRTKQDFSIAQLELKPKLVP
ncbi:Protein TBATA [Collichthys lucidus]|uniref:Protein TBATA n=1 Tax=Collichthys lucidus TaxID=240159 RepID=A0A4V6ATS9_COLLU|nr:Protein TBATA [Collichthys lucidus]